MNAHELDSESSLPRTFVESKRVRIRQLCNKDLAAFQKYRDREDVARFQSWVEWTTREAQAFIRNMKNVDLVRIGEWIQVGIALSESDELIGDIGIWQHRHQPEVAQIGYTIDPEFQQQGFAREAVAATCVHLFEAYKIKKILATVDTRNVPSMRLLHALGFVVIEKAHTSFKLEACEEWTFELCSSL